METLRHGNLETWKYRKHGDMKQKDRVTCEHGDIVTWTLRHGTGTWRLVHRDMDTEARTQIQGHRNKGTETWTWRHRHGDKDFDIRIPMSLLYKEDVLHEINKDN